MKTIPRHAIQFNTITADSCSQAHVQAAINLAQDGDTVQIPAGTCAWTGTLSATLNRSLTIQGAGAISATNGGSSTTGSDVTTILDHHPTGNPTGHSLLQFGILSGRHLRITGIRFLMDGSSQTTQNGVVHISGGHNCVRIDHNHFAIKADGSMSIGVYSGVTGVIDHNYFDSNPGNGPVAVYLQNGIGTGDAAWSAPDNFGTDKFIFIEDNRWRNGYLGDANTGGQRFVYRYNTAVMEAGDTFPSMGYVANHGITSARNRSSRAMEYYGNVLSAPAPGLNKSPFPINGGVALVWGNTVSQYRFVTSLNYTRRSNITYPYGSPPGGWGNCTGSSGTVWDGPGGYPCLDQPGRGQGDLLSGSAPNVINTRTGNQAYVIQAISPIYVWGNTLTPAGFSDPTIVAYDSGMLQPNRDLYRQFGTLGEPGSFDGTRGVGQGLLSARPSTGTIGVGYWATDTQALYVCNQTNSWTLYYTPYTYPHPIASTTPVLAVLSVSDPSGVDFGFVDVGANSTQSFTISNSGGGTLTGSVSLSGGAPMSIVSGGSYNNPGLTAGQSQTLLVRYAPTVQSNSGTEQTLTFTGGLGATRTLKGRTPFDLSSFVPVANGQITPPFVVTTEGQVSYVSQPTQTTNPSQSGRAFFKFLTPTATDYKVTLRVNAPTTSANSVLANINGEPSAGMQYEIPVTTGIQEREVAWNQFLTATINDNVTGTGLNQWEYSANWISFTGSTTTTAYQQDIHYSFTTNATAKFRFNGTQVKIYTFKEPPGGNIGYSIDGGAEVIVSNYSPTNQGNVLSYTSPVLADGNHDIVARVTGTHEAAATSNTIIMDKAEVYNAAAAPGTKLFTLPAATNSLFLRGNDANVKFYDVKVTAETAPPVPNQPPLASLDSDVTSGVGPFTVNLTAFSSDSDGVVASIELDWGDGTAPETIENPDAEEARSHEYAAVGSLTTRTITLQATDDDAATSQIASRDITVDTTPPPPPNQRPIAGITANVVSGVSPLVINFTLTSDDPDAGDVITEGTFDNDDDAPETITSPAQTVLRSNTYTAPGPGNSTFTATYKCNDGEVDSTTVSVQITVAPAPPPPSPVIGVSPTAVNFGSVTFGQSTNRMITVRNDGGQTLTGAISLPGAPFTLVTADPNYSLASGQTKVFQIRYTPENYNQDNTTNNVATFTGGGGTTVALSGSSPANVVPSVSLSGPTGTLVDPASVVYNATVSDSDGTITKVELFDGITEVAEDTTSPYSFSLTLNEGSYSFTAKATDSGGATTTSSPAITLTVTAPAEVPPTVSITAPSGGATYIAPASISITATAGATDATITNVEFFDGGTKIGEDTESPYELTYDNVSTIGSHSLTAIATDSNGNTTTSAAVSVTVNSLSTGGAVGIGFVLG